MERHPVEATSEEVVKTSSGGEAIKEGTHERKSRILTNA